MRPERAAAYAGAIPGCAVGRDARNPERCAVVVDNRWCWTEPQLFAALDERARRRGDARRASEVEIAHV